ncbi:MAG: rhodanese-like domain-containing protein [Pseudomonadota bacterium]
MLQFAVSQAGPCGQWRWLFCIVLYGLVAALGVGFSSQSGLARDDRFLPADQAMDLAGKGDIILIDVRSPQEWQQTGVPAGARTVTIHDPDGLPGFVAAIQVELAGKSDKPIALICAAGNRSTMAQAALREAGFSRVLNVKEGLFGNDSGPGWIARDLPLEPCADC